MVSKTDADLVFMELMSSQGRKTLNTTILLQFR